MSGDEVGRLDPEVEAWLEKSRQVTHRLFVRATTLAVVGIFGLSVAFAIAARNPSASDSRAEDVRLAGYWVCLIALTAAASLIPMARRQSRDRQRARRTLSNREWQRVPVFAIELVGANAEQDDKHIVIRDDGSPWGRMYEIQGHPPEDVRVLNEFGAVDAIEIDDKSILIRFPRSRDLLVATHPSARAERRIRAQIGLVERADGTE